MSLPHSPLIVTPSPRRKAVAVAIGLVLVVGGVGCGKDESRSVATAATTTTIPTRGTTACAPGTPACDSGYPVSRDRVVAVRVDRQGGVASPAGGGIVIVRGAMLDALRSTLPAKLPAPGPSGTPTPSDGFTYDIRLSWTEGANIDPSTGSPQDDLRYTVNADALPPAWKGLVARLRTLDPDLDVSQSSNDRILMSVTGRQVSARLACAPGAALCDGVARLIELVPAGEPFTQKALTPSAPYELVAGTGSAALELTPPAFATFRATGKAGLDATLYRHPKGTTDLVSLTGVHLYPAAP